MLHRQIVARFAGSLFHRQVVAVLLVMQRRRQVAPLLALAPHLALAVVQCSARAL